MTPCPCLHKALHVSLRFHVTSGNFHFILGNHLSKAARNESVTFVVCGVSSNQVHIQSSRFSLSAQRPRIYQAVESEVFSSSTEIRIYQDVESEVSSPAQRPGSARTRTQEQTGVSCVRLCYQWSRVFCRHRAARFTQKPLAPGCSANTTNMLALMH